MSAKILSKLYLSLSLSLSCALGVGLFLGGSVNTQAGELKSQGMYLDGGFGWGQSTSTDIAGTNTINELSWNANLGYQFNKFIAAEVGYISLPQFRNNNSTVIKDGYVIDLAVKGIIPVNDKLQLYGKLGVGDSTAHYGNGLGSHDEIVPVYALGASYALNNNSYIGFEAILTPKKNHVPGNRAVNLNIGYIF